MKEASDLRVGDVLAVAVSVSGVYNVDTMYLNAEVDVFRREAFVVIDVGVHPVIPSFIMIVLMSPLGTTSEHYLVDAVRVDDIC